MDSNIDTDYNHISVRDNLQVTKDVRDNLQVTNDLNFQKGYGLCFFF